MHAFDAQTDRRADSFLIARPRLHSMQRGNETGWTEYGVFRAHDSTQFNSTQPSENVQNFANGKKLSDFQFFFSWVESSRALWINLNVFELESD